MKPFDPDDQTVEPDPVDEARVREATARVGRDIRRSLVRCPNCGSVKVEEPDRGNRFWMCRSCYAPFDPKAVDA